FDDSWARSLIPVNWSRIVTFASVAVIVLVLAVAVLLLLRSRAEQARITRIATLSQQCDLHPGVVPEDFISLDPPLRMSLFERVADDQVWKLQVRLARCVAPELPRIREQGQQSQKLTVVVCGVIRDDDPYDPLLFGGICPSRKPLPEA